MEIGEDQQDRLVLHIKSRSAKTGRRRKIPVNDNKNETTELDGTYNEKGLTSSKTIEGKMEGKRGRGRPRQELLDLMMSEAYSKLQEQDQHRETRSHWRSGPARGQRT